MHICTGGLPPLGFSALMIDPYAKSTCCTICQFVHRMRQSELYELGDSKLRIPFGELSRLWIASGSEDKGIPAMKPSIDGEDADPNLCSDFDRPMSLL